MQCSVVQRGKTGDIESVVTKHPTPSPILSANHHEPKGASPEERQGEKKEEEKKEKRKKNKKERRQSKSDEHEQKPLI